MTDEHEYYVVAQPTGRGKPEELTLVFEDTVVTYSDFRGVKEASQIYPNHLMYGERTVVERAENSAYEVTDD